MLIPLFIDSICCILGDFLNNKTLVTNMIQPHLTENKHIKTIYISTDECEYVDALKGKEFFGESGVKIISPCDLASVSRGGPDNTRKLIAEIEMMRNGKLLDYV